MIEAWLWAEDILSLVSVSTSPKPLSLLGCHKGGCLFYLRLRKQSDHPDLGHKSNGTLLTWTESIIASLHNSMPLLLEPEAWTVPPLYQKQKQSNWKTEISRKLVMRKQRSLVKESESLLKLHNGLQEIFLFKLYVLLLLWKVFADLEAGAPIASSCIFFPGQSLTVLQIY